MSKNPIAMLNLPENFESRRLDFQPESLDDYLGQEDLKKKLKIYSEAAILRGEALDHILFFGPPGLGKTTLANIISRVMGVGIKTCSGPMLERTGDLVAILSSLQERDVFFIDEIHRIPSAVEEVLYGAMEQFKVDVIIGQGAGAQSINLPLNSFTLIGATTRPALLTAPLRSRFGISERLNLYKDTSLKDIVEQNVRHLGFEITDDASLAIAKCSRGTPRIAKKILRRVRDFAQVRHESTISLDIVKNALDVLGIDGDGLTYLDHEILKTIIKLFNGGPVGIETIASMVGEDSSTIEEVYEPYLLQKGYLEKTSRGRQVTGQALSDLKNLYLGQKSILKENS